MPPEASRTVGFMCRTVSLRAAQRAAGGAAHSSVRRLWAWSMAVRSLPRGLRRVAGACRRACWNKAAMPNVMQCVASPTTPARCAARETAGAHRTASGRGRRAPQSVCRFPCPPARGFDMPRSGDGQTRVWRRFGERTGLSGKRPGCRRRGAGTSASSRSGASARGPPWRVCLRAHRVAVLPGWRPGREAQDGGAPPAVASLSPESPAPASPSPLPSRCSSSTRARAAGSAGCCRAACGRTPSPRSAP